MVEEPVKLARANFSPCTAEEQQKQQMQAHPAVLTSRAQIWRVITASLKALTSRAYGCQLNLACH